MSGIKFGSDRSDKQPALGFCSNPECRVNGKEFRFRVDHDNTACPKCGATSEGQVGPLTLIHWIMPDDKGPITNSLKQRFSLACATKRAYLATASNNEAATDQIQLVTCEGCLRAALKHHRQKAVAANSHRRILLGD